ncbi:MAG: hypothetical protein ACRDRU_18220 [Pseudonocardiaceae bacterium]
MLLVHGLGGSWRSARFIDGQGLGAVDTVGSSMGARMVLELARRGVGGNTIALDPGGFWNDRELKNFSATLRASIPLVQALRPMLRQQWISDAEITETTYTAFQPSVPGRRRRADVARGGC